MVKIPVMGEVDEMPEQEMAAEAPAAQSGILMSQQAACI